MGTSLIGAVLLGCLSSVHCVGMCGPLALSLPVQQLAVGGRRLAVCFYHAGRIGVYTLAGLIFGLAGRHLYLAGWQQLLSVCMGSLILVVVVVRKIVHKTQVPLRMAVLFGPVERLIRWSWRSPGMGKFLLIGMANGLLPCGMVYIALAGALTLPGSGAAGAFMFFYGLGTLPMLLGLQIVGRLAGGELRLRLRRALPYVTMMIGLLLILRGLNLGIPFVSPVLAGQPGQGISCSHSGIR